MRYPSQINVFLIYEVQKFVPFKKQQNLSLKLWSGAEDSVELTAYRTDSIRTPAKELLFIISAIFFNRLGKNDVINSMLESHVINI